MFNDSRRKIASGMENTAYELMSAIIFRTTPKGDLPQYSYVFRKTEPLVTELKNVKSYRLGTMLYP